jgi:hypothetical protein
MISIPCNKKYILRKGGRGDFYTLETQQQYNSADAPCDQESVSTGRSRPSYGHNKCNGNDDPNGRSQTRLQRDSGGRPNNARRSDHTWPPSRGSKTPPTPAQRWMSPCSWNHTHNLFILMQQHL